MRGPLTAGRPAPARFAAILAVALAGVPGVPARGQTPVRPGDAVRITVVGPRRVPHRFSVTLLSAGPDSVTVRAGRERSFARASVVRWQRGEVRSATPGHMLLGLAGGAVAGALVGYLLPADREYAPLAALYGALPGAAVGLGLGVLVKGTVWVDAAPPPVAGSMAPGQAGPGEGPSRD